MELDERAGRLIGAIRVHLEALADGANGYATVYIGGGTPSCLPRRRLAELLHLIASVPGSEPIEWTIEANPGDIDSELLALLGDAGITRLSVGVQSLEGEARRVAARRSTAKDVVQALELIASTWKGRWSADLIYGLPGQSAAGIARDVGLVAGMGVGHISAYELTVEDDTPLGKAVAGGVLTLPDTIELDEEYDAVVSAMSEAGMSRYEVSNWAKDGQRCEHNLRYWRMDDWLAVGPGGVGNEYLGGGKFERAENTRDDEAYFADPLASTVRTRVEPREAMTETLIVALRTTDGLNLERFRDRFGVEALDVFGPLHELHPDLVALDGHRWRPSDRGLDILNVVLLDALAKAELYDETTRQTREGR